MPIYTGSVVMKVKVYNLNGYTKVVICYNSGSPLWPGGLMCSSTINLMLIKSFPFLNILLTLSSPRSLRISFSLKLIFLRERFLLSFSDCSPVHSALRKFSCQGSPLTTFFLDSHGCLLYLSQFLPYMDFFCTTDLTLIHS